MAVHVAFGLRGDPDPSGKGVRLRACLAAVDLRDAIDEFNARHPPTKQLPTRLGLDAGEIGLGPVAGELQAVGDPATTASRIEGLNRHLATKLLASARVIEGLPALLARRLGSFMLPGKSNAVEVFEIIGRRESASQDDERRCEEFAAAIHLFEAGRWSEAAEGFQRLTIKHPEDGPAGYYRDLCRRYAESPSGVSAGVVRIDAK